MRGCWLAIIDDEVEMFVCSHCLSSRHTMASPFHAVGDPRIETSSGMSSSLWVQDPGD